MGAGARRKYLTVGSIISESVSSKVTTIGAAYVRKRLDSGPDNWIGIAHLLEDPDVAGAIVKLTKRDYVTMCRDTHLDAAEQLLRSLGTKRCILLVHEAVAGYPIVEPSDPTTEDDDDLSEWNDRTAREIFGDVDDAVRQKVHELIERHGLSITTYKRNAEASVLAVAFIEDVASNLIFRLYVPSGRIFEEELARMLDLFHDWLGAVAGRNVRRAGYKTPTGRVIEFFGEEGATPSDWADELVRFTDFMEIVDDRPAATSALLAVGVSEERADELVARYAREARRILLDARHERERRMMQIRHALEAELTDEAAASAEESQALVERLVPKSAVIASRQQVPQPALVAEPPRHGPSVVVNQQFISRVEGVVAQYVAGDVLVGTPVAEVLELLRDIGGPQADEAQTAAHELADASAPPSVRVRAKQTLKSFLVRNARRTEQAAFDFLMRWIEGQIG